MARVEETRDPEPSEHLVGRFYRQSERSVGSSTVGTEVWWGKSTTRVNIKRQISGPSKPRVGRLTGWLRTHGGIDTIQLVVLSKENTLDWIKNFYASMAEGNPTPRGSGHTSPPIPRQGPLTLEGAMGTMAEMQNNHVREMAGVIESMTKLRSDFNERIQQLTEQGRRYDQQYAPAHIAVKQVGEVHWTLRNICRAPDLSHTNLADFDQWAEEMLHTIEAARTNCGDYNKVNIEFIYGSIELELRSQAEGHVPEKMDLINMTTPEAYLLTLEKLYTPADHLSTKRGDFEGRKQLPTESPMAYLAIMFRLYNRAKYNYQAFLVERFLIGLLNESLKLQIVLHHRGAHNYKTLRDAVVECHATMIKAVRVGKGTPPFSLVGLSQQSDVASQETTLQWKKRSRLGNSGNSNTDAMELAQIKGPPNDSGEMLFFMGPDDLQLRDMETIGDLDYWEGDLDEEQTTITVGQRRTSE